MKKLLLLFSFSFCALHFAIAQAPLVKQWDFRFGGTDQEWITCLQQTKDGGYIIGGYSYSNVSGDKSDSLRGAGDYWIVKLDSFGNKQWDKDFGGDGFDFLTSLQQTSDGGYILGGYSNSGISGDKTQAIWGTSNSPDYWIVKIDSLGIKEWDKDFGGTYYDALNSIQQTTDGGYILGGYSQSDSSGDKTQAIWGIPNGPADIWIVKTDSLGNKQWDKDLGGTDLEELYSLQQTVDGGYILSAISSSGISGNKTQATWGLEDYWIVKIDSLGNKLWDKDFGGTSSDFYLMCIQQTSDGGYIFGGWSRSGISGDKTQANWGNWDYWIVKTDSLGSKQWDKDFGGIGDDRLYYIQQTVGGGYILSGISRSGISGDKTENNLGSAQTWIVKTDSLGNKQWDKTMFTSGDDYWGLAVQTRDGCYAMANSCNGGIAGYKTQLSRGTWDYWIIKFCDTTQCNLTSPPITQTGDTLTVPFVYTTYQWFHDSIPITGATNNFYVAPASGNYNVVVTDSSGCSVGTGIINVIAAAPPDLPEGEEFSVHPNPARDEIIISYHSPVGEIQIEIYNSIGEKVFMKSFAGIQSEILKVPFGDLGAGIYLLQIKSQSGIVNKKFVISK